MQRTAEERAMHADWVRDVAAGDQAAFAALYDEFADVVYSIALHMLHDAGRAEDAAQDVWMKIWNVASTFEPTRASVATWISMLSHRHVIDVLRRASARPGDRSGFEPGDETAARIAASDDTAATAVDGAYGADVRAALATLPAAHQQAIELAYFSGLTQSEIAARIEKPLGTVKTYMYQGMRQLRDALGVSDGDAAS